MYYYHNVERFQLASNKNIEVMSDMITYDYYMNT